MHSERITVSDLMNTKVQTDSEDQNIMSACNIMYANNIGSVIIVTHDSTRGPLGIITEDSGKFRTLLRILILLGL